MQNDQEQPRKTTSSKPTKKRGWLRWTKKVKAGEWLQVITNVSLVVVALATLIITCNKMEDQVAEMKVQVGLDKEQNRAFLDVTNAANRPRVILFTSPDLLTSTITYADLLLDATTNRYKLTIDSVNYAARNIGYSGGYITKRFSGTLTEEEWNIKLNKSVDSLVVAINKQLEGISNEVDVLVCADSVIEFKPKQFSLDYPESDIRRFCESGETFNAFCYCYLRYTDLRAHNYDYLLILGLGFALNSIDMPEGAGCKLVARQKWTVKNRGDIVVRVE